MSVDKEKKQDDSDLRQRAERQLNSNPVEGSADESDSRKLLQQLQVHQIELEMQNEELRLARIEIEEGLQQYTDLYDFAPISYFTLKNDGTIHQANLAGATLLGLNRQRLIGHPMAGFFTGQDQSAFTSFLDKVCQNNTREICELHILSRDATRRFLHIEGVASIGGELCNLAVTDITENKRVEEILQINNLQLEEAKIAADKANQAKSAFLSGMSHELRSPLNAILGFAQLLESGKPPPTDIQEVRLQQIIKAGWYLLELISQILDLAVIESGKFMLTRESVSLNEIMRECHEMIVPMAQKRDIDIKTPQLETPFYIMGDRVRLKQVLINLLSNAIKYNREHGSVTLSYALSTAGRIRLNITDTGNGLSPEQLAQLFQPFNRLGQEAGGVEGSGIGLVVSRHLIEIMGGEIGVKSTEGVGSEFWIELIQADHTSIAAEKTKRGSVELQGMQKSRTYTLLHVEDNPANLLLVEHIISDYPSLQLLSAHDGSLGVALARAHLPAVILMDINLQGMSGIAAMNILRRDPATAHIPVIAVSAKAMPHDIEQGLEAGFFRYITKPINVNLLMSALDDALKSLK
ncbi:MAG: ATP-binding protein [Gallionella sp.]